LWLYVRESIEYAVEADERIKCFVLVPKHINRTAPAIFAHHQHASQFHLGKSEVVGLEGDPDQAYAAELAERGYVVIAPDALAFEERNWSTPSGYAEYFELATRLVQGTTLLSKCLHDVSVALDYLVDRPEVDPLRIGFIGHSYGGKTAIWAPALDNRIRASVSNCGCVNYKQSLIRETGVQMEFCLPGVLHFGDVDDVVRLVAPRALLLQDQTINGLGEPTRYLNTLNRHFQKESSSLDIGRVVMSSRRKCDKRRIIFLTSISKMGVDPSGM
jgi:dienelactone hydrolase